MSRGANSLCVRISARQDAIPNLCQYRFAGFLNPFVTQFQKDHPECGVSIEPAKDISLSKSGAHGVNKIVPALRRASQAIK
jgi:hypothetical protein